MLRIPVASLCVLLLASFALLGCGGGGGTPGAPTVVAVPPNDGPPVGLPVDPAPVPPVPNPNDPPPPAEEPPTEPPVDPPVEPPVEPPVVPPLPSSFMGFGAALDLAYNPGANELYAVDSDREALIVREGADGEERVLAHWTFGRVLALTWKEGAERIVGLVEVPMASDAVPVGEVEPPLTPDPVLRLALMEISPLTGELLDTHLLDADLRLASLTWHEADQLYYAVDEALDAIVALKPAGAIKYVVRLPGPMDVRGLAVHPASGELVALDVLEGRLVEIDRYSSVPIIDLQLNRSDLSGLEAWRGAFVLSLDLDDNLAPLIQVPGTR